MDPGASRAAAVEKARGEEHAMGSTEAGVGGVDPEAVIRARFRLGVFVSVVAACLSVALTKDTHPATVPPAPAPGDLVVYRQIVQRVHGGDSYYDAALDELRTHGYPTRSVFNVRTPLYAWLLGRATGPGWGRAILMVGLLIVLVAACRDLPEDFGVVPAAVGAVFLAGATAWCLGGEGFYMMEFWAAMLIGISVAAYRRGLTVVGVAAGLLAVFYRELALPYAVVCAGIAVWQGRRREAAAWAVGLALFAAFMGYHAYQVHSRLTAADLSIPGGWVRFGGIPFLLATARMNVFLMPLPLWCTALYLPLAAVGLSGGRGESGWRVGLTALLFLAAFSVVGNPFNFYWGFLDAPLLAFGIAGAPRAVSRLIGVAFDTGDRLDPSFPRKAAQL
jgi:hypothetical protein